MGARRDLESFEDVRARGSLAREYTVTYRDHLESNERDRRGRVLERGPRPSLKCRSNWECTSAFEIERRRHDALRHPRAAS